MADAMIPPGYFSFAVLIAATSPRAMALILSGSKRRRWDGKAAI